MGVIFISKLNRAIVFSICFMFIFNISSTVYASHKSKKDERFIATGTLVSTGLAFLAKAEVIAVLSAVALRLGMDMNNTTQSAVQEFCEKYPDVTTTENFGKSENGLIAVSKNAIDKFTTFLKDMFKENPQDTISSEMTSINFNYNKPECHSLDGFTIGPYSKDIQFGKFVNGTDIQKPQGYLTLKAGDVATFKVGDFSGWTFNNYFGYTTRDITRYQGYGTLLFPKNYDYGTYVPENKLKDDLGNVYTGDGDFILNPSWDINSNTGVLEGLPALPWEDKQFGSVGNVGVLNPDGTITDSSIPDVENPDVPNEDVGEQTGILGILQKMLDWMLNFFDNLLQMLKDFISFLFVPTKAISTWEGFKDNFNNKFKFVGQLQSLNFKTNNNDRFKVTVPIAGHETVIAFPEVLENNVPLLRNLLKYSFYIITLFTVVSILRPKFTVNSD